MNVGMVFMSSDASVAKPRFGLDDLEPGLELGNVDERKKKRERRTRLKMFPTDVSGGSSSAGSSNNSSR